MPHEVGQVKSEFAALRVTLDDAANGTRLRIEDLRTGHVRYLDALELETVAWLPGDVIDHLLDPALHRWVEDP
jgi:hypothetical protein